MFGKGTVSGTVGGLISGAIYSGSVANMLFPTETVTLIQGVIIWIIIGALLGMAGGGAGGFVSEKKDRPVTGMVNWVTVGAFLGPLTLGAAVIVANVIHGGGVGTVGSPFLVVVGGSFGGAFMGAIIQNRKGLFH